MVNEWSTKAQVTRIKSTTITNMHIITNIKSQVRHDVAELFEYISKAREVAWPVLAKLHSMASSVESSICTHTRTDEKLEKYQQQIYEIR